MTKKINILIFFIILPLILIQVYSHFFEFSGNWLEDSKNYLKMGFLIISLLGSIKLFFLSKINKDRVWLILTVLIFILLLLYGIIALLLINSSLSL